MATRTLALFVTAVLDAVTGGSSASAHGSPAGSPDQALSQQPSSSADSTSRYQKLETEDFSSYGSVEELFRARSEPLSEEEMEEAVRESKKAASVAHYYPDTDDDNRTNPPPFDQDGDQIGD